MSEPTNGHRPLRGYRVRDANQVISVLRERRQARRWSQARLGEQLCVSGPQVSQWETGLHRPNPDTLIDWANALGLDIALIPRDELKPCPNCGVPVEGVRCPDCQPKIVTGEKE